MAFHERDELLLMLDYVIIGMSKVLMVKNKGFDRISSISACSPK
jgi:hypothetical protein